MCSDGWWVDFSRKILGRSPKDETVHRSERENFVFPALIVQQQLMSLYGVWPSVPNAHRLRSLGFILPWIPLDDFNVRSHKNIEQQRQHRVRLGNCPLGLCLNHGQNIKSDTVCSVNAYVSPFKSTTSTSTSVLTCYRLPSSVEQTINPA